MRLPDLGDLSEGFDDEEGRPADPEEALDLVDLLLAALTDGTNSSIDYRGDDRAYRRNRRKLEKILTPLGIRQPFPWPSLGEALAAAKAKHSGPGSWAPRRDFFSERAKRVNQVLRTRIADRAAGDVSATVVEMRDTATDVLTDPAAIRTELTRIETSLPRDPGTAIGKAKNLIEATAKAVLDELGEVYNDNDEVNKLVHAAMQSLGIDRNSVAAAHDVDLANVMGRLNSLTIALANLRNHAGDAHGASTPPVGLDLRHGRLAVRAAVAWCAFMLDTLHDQTA